MTAGTIAKWLAKPGDALNAGDVLCEIETDKAAVGFEMQDSSVLAKILVEAMGPEVAVGKPIAFTVEDRAAYEAFLKMDPKDYPVVSAAAASPAPAAAAPAAAPAPAAVVAPAHHEHAASSSRLLSPAARNMVQRDALDVSKVAGTGKHDMITKSDVITARKAGLVQSGARPAAHSTPAVAAAPVAQPTAVKAVAVQDEDHRKYIDIPNSNMRKVIAKRLTESKMTVPHFYVTMECDVTEVMKLRADMKRDFEANISVNDVVIKAAALALRDVPEANAKWNAATRGAVLSEGVDISVAVATPTGLITPIIFQADRRSLLEINTMVKELAGRARLGKLKPEEYQGGTFSISNLGMFGINNFSAVINPPQACILAVGAGVKKVIPPRTVGGEPEVTTTVTVQLSADRRVIDETLGAQFLQVFRTYFNNPKALLL